MFAFRLKEIVKAMTEEQDKHLLTSNIYFFEKRPKSRS